MGRKAALEMMLAKAGPRSGPLTGLAHCGKHEAQED
jgi:hypothetical protein